MALIKPVQWAVRGSWGRNFAKCSRPFIYRSFLDLAALEEIQEIKGRIETSWRPAK